VTRAVLNAPAAGFARVLASSPRLGEALFPTLCQVGAITAACCAKGCSAADMSADATFAAEAQRFLVSAQWMLDPSDPINYAGLLASSLGDRKRLMLQLATGDDVFPNEASEQLAALLGFDEDSPNVKRYDPGACAGKPTAAHGMLLADCGAGTAAMQRDLVTFLAE
jgi:hypothetical protein